MSVYQIDSINPSSISLEERHREVQVISYQRVIENSKLVEGVFRGWNAHFGDDLNMFSRGNLDSNFANLRRMAGLLSEQEHVSSLIESFTITVAGRMEHVPVGPGKFKLSLFIYWLSNGMNTFDMDDEKRELTRSYFGSKMCNDAMSNEQTEHIILRMLLTATGATITVDRTEEEHAYNSGYQQDEGSYPTIVYN